MPKQKTLAELNAEKEKIKQQLAQEQHKKQRLENLKGTVKELPKREAIDVPVDEMLIVELYSK